MSLKNETVLKAHRLKNESASQVYLLELNCDPDLKSFEPMSLNKSTSLNDGY